MIYQSATSITDFKNCPMLYYLRHVLRIRPVETPEAARQGTNWHKCLEILTATPGDTCQYCASEGADPFEHTDCAVCEGQRVIPKDLRAALIRYMDHAYATCPPSVDLVDWGVEKTVLLYSAIGWQWYYQDDKVETLATEVPFDREIDTLYRRRGRIDRIVRREVLISLGEYKSTSKPIDSGSAFWDRLPLDSQVTLYLIEARRAQLAGELEQYGIKADDPLISGVLYDVWHKPTTKPKKLSMADSKKFGLTGEYFGEKFELGGDYPVADTGPLTVNGVLAEITEGAPPKPTKKNPAPTTPFAIRETPEMFGARLLADIQEQPEKYFVRRDIPRTDKQLAKADEEFSKIARLTHFMEKRNLWFRNENHCHATYLCSMHPICYHDLDVTDGKVPEGFKCLRK